MKSLHKLVLVSALLGLAACSSSTSGTTVKPDAGSDTAKTDAADTGTVKTDGAVAACTGVVSGACGTCLEGACCAEVAACNAVTGCMDCATGGACDATNQTPADALSACATNSCATECGGGGGTPVDMVCAAPATAPSAGSCVTVDGTNNKCNPVTNQGCNTAAGEACDFGASGFECYAAPPANTEALCAACDITNGPACLPTSTCIDATAGGTKCARFCCTDADCGAGKCDTTVTGGAPGVCVK